MLNKPAGGVLAVRVGSTDSHSTPCLRARCGLADRLVEHPWAKLKGTHS
jgi:hypothetical protein